MSSFLDQIGSIFFPQWTNPSNAAMPYLQGTPSMAEGLYNPYIDTGNAAMGKFAPQVESMATPAGSVANYNALASGYSQSPGVQNSINNATQQTNQVAAAGGMAGSPTEQTAVANETVALSDEDFDNYMKMVSGYQTTGLGGEADLMHQGAQASNSLADMLAKNASEEAAYAYGGARSENMHNQQQSSMWTSMFGDIASLF